MFLCQQLDCLGNGSSIQMGSGKMTILGKNIVHLFENVSKIMFFYIKKSF